MSGGAWFCSAGDYLGRVGGVVFFGRAGRLGGASRGGGGCWFVAWIACVRPGWARKLCAAVSCGGVLRYCETPLRVGVPFGEDGREKRHLYSRWAGLAVGVGGECVGGGVQVLVEACKAPVLIAAWMPHSRKQAKGAQTERKRGKIVRERALGTALHIYHASSGMRWGRRSTILAQGGSFPFLYSPHL